MSERPTKVNLQDVRQGKTGVGVSKVLAWGLILVCVAFVILYFVLRSTS